MNVKIPIVRYVYGLLLNTVIHWFSCINQKINLSRQKGKKLLHKITIRPHYAFTRIPSLECWLRNKYMDMLHIYYLIVQP